MNRVIWQQIAEERSKDAQALLAAGQWSGAYYLAGYAVECGLKSCVLRRLANSPELIFLEKRFSEKCWTHDPEELVSLAGLVSARDTATAANVQLESNWQDVKDWSEKNRYSIKTEAEARKLVTAITDATNVVLPWIKIHW